MPDGPRTADGVGWRRAYTGGTVLVNADETTPQTYGLDRPHLDADGHRVESVTLGPGRGMVLVFAEE